MVFAQTADAQSYKAEPYFTADEMPDMLRWGNLAPPAENSAAFIYDIKQYYLGKELRLNPERAAIAVRDANYGLNTIIKEFSIPFGMQITKEHTPKVFTLLRDALATTDSICKLPKAFYMRPRPFMVFNEPTLTPHDEPSLRRNGSFPSGHTILGWSAALLLSEINPAQADTIIARGLMYGESRVICGAHWQSDVDAARIAASVAYAKLHTSERFLKQLAAAKKEFLDLKDKYPPTENELSNDSTYNEYKREVASMESMERRFQCRIQKYPFGFDETTGLKMLFIKTNESPYNVSNGVDYVLLTNDKNEVVYVVKSVMRHDKEINNDESLYGLYVVGREAEGEIEISYHDYFSLERLIFQMGQSPEFLNCTTIKFRVAAVPHLIPFSPISDENREDYQRFFSN
jgi:acid phosphatase (class A)